jgi:hypothetical protein
MKLTLLNESNSHCWLYGRIDLEDEFLCNTLEFGSCIILPPDTYELKLQKDGIYNKMEVCIIDFMGNVKAKLLQSNTWYYKDIELRKETVDICIGLKVLTPRLTMSEYISHLLCVKIAGAMSSGEKVKFIILDSEIRRQAIESFI